MENKTKSIIEKTLKDNLKDEGAVFVFPTQLACDKWSEWVVKYFDIKAVALNRFLSWDRFCESIKDSSTKKGATPITKVVRRLFSQSLLEENSKKPFLKAIIPPAYAKNYKSFVSVINKALVSLSLYDAYIKGSPRDDEGRDLCEIFSRYKDFLTDNGLYESAYIRPPILFSGRVYYVFYPETLNDYYEYKDLLCNDKNIKIIRGGVDTGGCEVTQFKDSRLEINYIARYIKRLHDDGLDYSEIAIHIPNIDDYAPYLARELTLYEIPFASRSPVRLGCTRAGGLFSLIKGVYPNFDVEEIKKLLLLEAFPWRERGLIESVIRFGENNKCNIDVWDETFAAAPQFVNEKRFISDLKKRTRSLVTSRTFLDVQKGYFAFRDTFFDVDLLDNDEKQFIKTNKLMGRAIEILGELLDAVKKYPTLLPSDPFSYFIELLGETLYTEQEGAGVTLVSYKNAACAPCACNIVPDCSQKSVTVVSKELGFLSDDKRAILFGGEREDNLTNTYLTLYHECGKRSLFTYALKTFSGYGEAVSSLKISSPDYDLVARDPYEDEAGSFFGEGDFQFATEVQRKGFSLWARKATKNNFFGGRLKFCVRDKASETLLKDFFNCPVRYFLKKDLFLGEEFGYKIPDPDDKRITGPFDMGNLYHKIFERFFLNLKDKDLAIRPELEKDLESYLDEDFDKILDSLKFPYLSRALIKDEFPAIKRVILAAGGKFFERFEGNKVFSVEETYDREGVTGRPDLILVSEALDITIVDIKSTAGAVPDLFYFDALDGDNIFDCADFQIPLYTYLLEAALEKKFGKARKVTNALFFVVAPSQSSPKFFFPVYGEGAKISREDFDFSIKRALECVKFFLEVVNGECDLCDIKKDAFYTWEKCNECLYCAICRTTFNVEGREPGL